MDGPSRPQQRRRPGARRAKKSQKPKYEDCALELLEELDNVNMSQAIAKQHLSLAIMVKPEDETCSMIHKYLGNSQNHNFGMKILDIVRLFRSSDTGFDYDREKFKNVKCRYMLWHGCPTRAVVPILTNGFQLPVPKRQMFGTGIYFADRASKSAQYCVGGSGKVPPAHSIGYLFLCDVFVGNWYLAKNSHTDYTKPPTYTKKGVTVQADSVKVLGGHVPDEGEEELRNNCYWPLGQTIPNNKFPSYTLQFNEYIIFDPSHVKIKYLVKVEFLPNPV